MNPKLFAYQERRVKTSTGWILFLFLGWSYGSMDQMGKQILYYMTLGGFGIWGIYRLFTLDRSIKEFNLALAEELELSEEEKVMMGITKHPVIESDGSVITVEPGETIEGVKKIGWTFFTIILLYQTLPILSTSLENWILFCISILGIIAWVVVTGFLFWGWFREEETE